MRKFITGVRAFYENATSYALSHLPFEDALLKNAQFVDIMRRTDSYFEQVQYFVECFSDFLPYSAVTDQELLFGEFTDFQTMQDTEIPSYIWADAKVREKDEGGDVVEYHRMDVLWSYLGTVKDIVTGQLRFSRLAKIAKLVLTIPHSNVDEERVFSLVRQNKTDFRSSLSLDGTLASILTVNMSSEEPCYKFEPAPEVIMQSKSSKKVNLIILFCWCYILMSFFTEVGGVATPKYFPALTCRVLSHSFRISKLDTPA